MAAAFDPSRDSYFDELERGASAYMDVLEQLNRRGLPASFTQTGGMCAAIEVRLERGFLLVTDASEELPWSRAHLRGWGVGYYPSDDCSDGPEQYVEDDADSSTGRVLLLADECLELVAKAAFAGPRAN